MMTQAQQHTSKTSKSRRRIAITVIAILLISVVLLAALPFVIMGNVVGRHIERDVYTAAEFGVAANDVTLTTDDGLELAAWLVEAGEPKATVILLSGIENPSVTAFFGYAKLFAENGYQSLLIEMRAHNASQGEEVALGMEEWMDVKAGVDYLRGEPRFRDVPIVAMGTSMGGATVTVAAGQVPEIDAVIALSAYSSWEDVFIDTMVHMGAPSPLAELERPFIRLYLGLHYGFDALSYTPLQGVEKLDNRPILLMHSTEDSQVPYPSYERLLERAQAASADVSTFVRDGDEHFIVYESQFQTPEGDTAFSGALLTFLDTHFGG